MILQIFDTDPIPSNYRASIADTDLNDHWSISTFHNKKTPSGAKPTKDCCCSNKVSNTSQSNTVWVRLCHSYKQNRRESQHKKTSVSSGVTQRRQTAVWVNEPTWGPDKMALSEAPGSEQVGSGECTVCCARFENQSTPIHTVYYHKNPNYTWLHRSTVKREVK